MIVLLATIAKTVEDRRLQVCLKSRYTSTLAINHIIILSFYDR